MEDRTWKPCSKQVREAKQIQQVGWTYGLKGGGENKNDSRVSDLGPHLPKLEIQGTGLVLTDINSVYGTCRCRNP